MTDSAQHYMKTAENLINVFPLQKLSIIHIYMSNCKLSLSVVSDSTKWTLISALNMNIQSVFMIILEWFLFCLQLQL